MGLSSSRYGLLVAGTVIQYGIARSKSLAVWNWNCTQRRDGWRSGHTVALSELCSHICTQCDSKVFFCFSFDHDTFFGGHFECDDDAYTPRSKFGTEPPQCWIISLYGNVVQFAKLQFWSVYVVFRFSGLRCPLRGSWHKYCSSLDSHRNQHSDLITCINYSELTVNLAAQRTYNALRIIKITNFITICLVLKVS